MARPVREPALCQQYRHTVVLRGDERHTHTRRAAGGGGGVLYGRGRRRHGALMSRSCTALTTSSHNIAAAAAAAAFQRSDAARDIRTPSCGDGRTDGLGCCCCCCKRASIFLERVSLLYRRSVRSTVGYRCHCYCRLPVPLHSGASTLGPGRGHGPPNRRQAPNLAGPLKLWLGPKISRTLDTLWSIDSQKISKFHAIRCQIARLKCT